MEDGIIACAIAPHTPRMANESEAPDFVHPLITGLREMGRCFAALEADCIVVQSTHWVSTFNWYTSAQPVHQGHCVADEAPDMIPGIAYRYRGDPALAGAIATTARADQIPCRLNTSTHYAWDYGTYVPMHYLDPEARLPVVSLPTVVLADLSECMRIGPAVNAAARAAGKRVIYVASTALSHALVRVPDAWPSEARQHLDRQLLRLLTAGRINDAKAWLPVYARDAVAEMGGRVLAGFLGALGAMQPATYGLRLFGDYAQSSGSGNQSLVCSPLLA